MFIANSSNQRNAFQEVHKNQEAMKYVRYKRMEKYGNAIKENYSYLYHLFIEFF